VPTVEGLEFAYALHPLPPGRMPFRRWRWELWHGARLEAAGWRLTRRDAERALHAHATRVGHAMFGLPAPDPARAAVAAAGLGLAPGRAVRVDAGSIAFRLVPVRLEDRPGALGLAP
jgi:hypothetical protein